MARTLRRTGASDGHRPTRPAAPSAASASARCSWARKTPVDESHRMLDRFVDAGGNFLDTADVYGDGESERDARAVARRAAATRSCSRRRCASRSPTRRGEGLAPDRIRAACDASLRRLGVDVDRPLPGPRARPRRRRSRRRSRRSTGSCAAGKVRALGASNYPAWLLAWAVALQDRDGWAPFVSLQPQYSLVERSVEVEIAAVLPRRRPRRAAVGAARRRLPDRPLLARRADRRRARRMADGGRRPRGGAGTGARSSATSASSTRREAIAGRARRDDRRRSRSRGCWASTA